MLQPSRGTLWVVLCQRSKRLARPLPSQKSTVIAAPAHKQEVIRWPESHQYISSSQALYNDDTIFGSTFINRYCILCSMCIILILYPVNVTALAKVQLGILGSGPAVIPPGNVPLMISLWPTSVLTSSFVYHNLKTKCSSLLQKNWISTAHLVLMDVDLICIGLQHMLQFDRCAEDTLFHSQHHHAPQVSLKELQGCAVGIKPSARCNRLLIYCSLTEEGTQQKILY